MEKEKNENNIIFDAYYLINKFNENQAQVTNMQIQKLMYFFEAYYMNIYEVEKLYDCNFNAWAFGPVAIPLYKEFKKFGNDKIELTEDNKKEGENISKEKKELLDIIYNVFKGIPAMKLVEFTHMSGSPWSIVWERNGKKVGYGENTHINKKETKDWFRRTFEKSK